MTKLIPKRVLVGLSPVLLVIGFLFTFLSDLSGLGLLILVASGVLRPITILAINKDPMLRWYRARLSALRISAWTLLVLGLLFLPSQDYYSFIGAMSILISLFIFQEIYVTKNSIRPHH